MRTGGRPFWNQLARIFRILSLLVLVIIIVYVGLSIYSATELRGAKGSGTNGTASIGPNGDVIYSASVNLTNPGLLPINSIQVSAEIHTHSGTLLASGGSPPISIAPGTVGAIPVTITIPITGSPEAQALLTHDSVLPSTLWVNITYATLFQVQVVTATNFTWGAPFQGLNATLGTPIAEPNGTVLVPVNLSFANHAQFADVGTLSADLRDSSAHDCGTVAFPMHVDPKTNYAVTDNLYLAPGCDPRGGTALLVFQGPGLSIALPPEPIP